MALSALNWRRLATQTPATALVSDVLDAVYTALGLGTYYDGSARTPGSGSAWTVSRAQAIASSIWTTAGFFSYTATHPANVSTPTATPGGAPVGLTAGNMGIPVVLQLVVADAASGNADFTGMPFKMLVTRVDYTKNAVAGNAGNSIRLDNGTGGAAITHAMNNATANGGDSTDNAAGTLLNANTTVNSGATLRCVTVRAGGDNGATLTVHGFRVV